MAAIHLVHVRGHEQRSQPKPHVVYRIEVQASVRSWEMWRRYSEFVDLHNELIKTTGATPPVSLPPKHIFAIRKNDEKILEERRIGLEAYLRALISSKDGQWRETRVFNEFLGVPIGRHDNTRMVEGSQFTLSSWLDEHSELQNLVRDIRADINKRNSLSDMGDVSASHSSNLQAKKKLVALLDRLGIFAAGLETLGSYGMAEGELQRRTDMVARLQDDCEKLGKMVIASRQVGRRAQVLSSEPASQADRAALLPSSQRGNGRPARRVFGAPPQETDVTRPLDDQGLLQLQKNQVVQQDDQLEQLTAILRRQKQLGIAISDEINEQNELLDGLTRDVDVVGGKLNSAQKNLRLIG
ncbi:hypothetical protein M422DRAFT_250826 [Sphaerobolus stellatus SS14]|uniref:Unplaced genomic scaffold SPHSTscaffold_36, whole genome shotgun sequence n=1 Tax=Sphaerobolus stellatus (strain SS14) TaxID=990650 RepID=A0A0C9W1T1_SPHS4|nr:hypothetical protein M422DRAFT_250826 [Sphaerobolus stellatus SS14]